ncbi:MAG: GntR family transcriptional regulator [Steroidobacteraceae bacterium]|jgi:DNA-binding GntR family transcriptional regulator|nr:GntR family transcriptional regulator [Steroidobacteraceae bacterium]
MVAAAEKAYDVLLQRIQCGQLPSGAFLVEGDLARDLGVSRTPVREAIRRLAAEGLVLTEGRRRAVVREFAEDQVEELYELRARLESYAAARAATRLEAPALEHLRTLATEMEACAAAGTELATACFADLNDRFHQLILDGARGEHLAAALRPVLQIQLLLLQRYRHTIREHLERSCWHHRELIRAFELRDPELAGRQMELHMLSARSAGPSNGAGVGAAVLDPIPEAKR